MRACRFYKREHVRIDEIPIPVPREGQALIRVEWCGICASDLHEYSHGNRNCPPEGNPHPLTGDHVPVVLGHEFCGRIEWASPTSKLHKGEAVMVDPRLYCSSCVSCTMSETNSCENFGFLGLSGSGGGLSEYVAVNENQLYPLGNAPLHLAALLEPLAVAWHGVSVTGVEVASKVPILIVGGGPIGLAVAAVLRARGAEQIFISEPAKIRHKTAGIFADKVFNPLDEDVASACRELTSGKGVRIVFDCAGIQSGMEDGMKALGLSGVYMNLAGWSTMWKPPQEAIVAKEVSLKGSMSYKENDFAEVVEAFVNGKFDNLEEMITSRIHLEDVEELGIQELLKTKDNQVKVLVTPITELLNTSTVKKL
ncbi:chlorophyll synthesis pathway protein BchC [Rhinocladiella mackenziei CBS 650.93]|uniref:Chlorophyll synthesis pathway protein BchC n=1 Tax=Rhinocladiella mackenziei CBS 650.93 TaxID=1442369 RepID=A0A0D2IIQ7_9EURO|nr:chlorophyll synthesis pathway protein BchC [Rhinocladiella mackenziei CBS 650.93]KIX05624.1 chlorophyll synthesis pathway protein BchC [Rhinocladiella mackenziei CBS 650.93]